MKKSTFYRYLFALTLPIILQNLITTSLNLLDTMMIGRLNENALAAVGIANQFYFLFSLFIFGIAGGSGVLIAQLYGKKDYETIKKVLSRSLISGMTLTLIFSFIGLAGAEKIIGLFNKTPYIVETGSGYLRITIVSYLFTSVSFVLASGLRSIKHTKLPMYASFIGLCINGGLNYLLIFGHLGFTALGTTGAAIATLIARTIECIILIVVTVKWVPELHLSLDDFYTLPPHMEKALKKVTLPILFNEACWGIGSVTYIGLYAHLGTQATASMQIASTIINLFMVIAFGLSYSALVVVGNEVGANDLKKAFEVSKKIRHLSLITGVTIAVILFPSAPVVVYLFNVSETVQVMTKNVLQIFALILPFRIINMVMIVGVLRGGGDATFGSLLQGFTLWGIGIPLTYVAGFVLHQPLHYVVGISVVEELVKLIIISRRYQTKTWIKNVVSHESECSISI